LECIFITTSLFVEDAYTNPLVVKLGNPEPDPNNDEPILNIGLMGSYFMRVSLQNPGRLMNIKNGNPGDYQRKAFVRVIDEGEDNPSSRLAALKVIKEFMEDPNNNRYGTKVFIQEPGWDLTVTPLKKLDNFLEYKEIVKIIKDMYLNVDGNWAVENLDSALSYFTRGYIPVEAHSDIGIPMEYIGGFVVPLSIAPPPSIDGNNLDAPVGDNVEKGTVASVVQNVTTVGGENLIVPDPAVGPTAEDVEAKSAGAVAPSRACSEGLSNAGLVVGNGTDRVQANSLNLAPKRLKRNRIQVG
jgi:hypothetical protein